MEPFTAQLDAAIRLHRAGQLAEAEDLYRQLLAECPQSAAANSALGLLLTARGRFEEAREYYQNLIALQPDDFVGHKLLADACSELGDCEAATLHYRDAACQRGDFWLWHLRAEIVAPMVFASNGVIDAYRERLTEQLARYRSAPFQLDIDELITSGCKPPLVLAYQGRDDRALKEQFAALFAERLPAEIPHAGRGLPHVGFVVTEGNEGVFLRGMAGLVERLDRRQLKVSIVCGRGAEERFRAALTADTSYVPLGERMSENLAIVRAARCDLLYYWEIGTDCTNYFLPFFRLAPIQCTSWGWPVTSGIAEVDYFVSAEALEPPDADRHYTESLVRLRHLPNYYPTERFPALPDVRDRMGISRQCHLYFCGQNPRKLHPDFDRLVAEILRRDANGVVALVEAAKPHVTQALRLRMNAQLGDEGGRVLWLPRMSRHDYLAWMAAADCVLDTPHYCGGANSTYDAFAVGAPVVTLTGAFHRGRYTTAAYTRMGLPDLVAATPDAYVNRALSLATDREYARHCRQQITERRSCLFDCTDAVEEFQRWLLTAIATIR